ncbi:hypothetical protein B0T09DRAFT_260625 [Sordaria sp. MPI-SDFR-AT-0083]|nr:hypothetical protein B0T09DRAFT_260625 [Sordaria sp. MPI-SDFR-AT-0083]
MAPVTDPFPVPRLQDMILAGPTIYSALHSLMVKSAECVQNRIQTRGFSFVPSGMHLRQAARDNAGKQEYDKPSQEHSSGSTSCSLPCCTTHQEMKKIKKKDKGENVSHRGRGSRRHKQRGRTLRWRSVSSSREDSYSSSRSRSRGRRRRSLSSSGSESDSRRSRSDSRSSSSSSHRSIIRSNLGAAAACTRHSVSGPLPTTAKRFNMPYHSRITGMRGTNPPPLPPPPPGWPIRNMGLNGGIGNGVSRIPPPPPPPPTTIFSSAGTGRDPNGAIHRQHNYSQPQIPKCHGTAMELTGAYLGHYVRHAQVPSQTLPVTTAFPALSTVVDAVPGSSSRLDNLPSTTGQFQYRIPPPPPPPPHFPRMSRGVSHYNGSAPWHVQKSNAYSAAGIIPPPPPPPPPLAVIQTPSSSTTCSSSSSSLAKITATPTHHPALSLPSHSRHGPSCCS